METALLKLELNSRNTCFAGRPKLADLDSLSVKQLKDIIKNAGLSLVDCVEKKDLKQKAEKLLSEPQPDPGKKHIRQGPHNAYLWTPDTLGENPLPLLVIMHGASKNGAWNFQSMVNSYRWLASHAQILVLIPEAVDYTWDFITSKSRRDMDFVQFALNDVRSRYAVDDSRIAVMGMSDGGSVGLSLAICNPTIFQVALVQCPGFFHDPGVRSGGLTRKPLVFMEYGLNDSMDLPGWGFERVTLRNWDRLKALGYKVEFRAYPNHGHNTRQEFAGDAVQYWMSLPPLGAENQDMGNKLKEMWKIEQVIDLGVDSRSRSALVKVLDEGVYTLIPETLQALNSDEITCEQGFCSVYSSESQRYFLLYRADKQRDALIALHRADQQAEWSLSQIHELGANEPPATVQVLDRAMHTSVRQTLVALNAGTIACPQGFCSVYSVNGHKYFLLYKTDKKQEAFRAAGI